MFSLVWGSLKLFFVLNNMIWGWVFFLFVWVGVFLFCFELLSVVYPVFMQLITTDQLTLAHHMGDFIFRISFRINTRIILVFYLPELCAPLNM